MKKVLFSVITLFGTCSQGEQCWCRIIEPILYKDGDTEE